MNDIVSYLFSTNAIRFCEENKPFWYTSGKIGPYFINTHFVYGNEKEASDFLSYIDECLSDKKSLPEKIFKKVLTQYNTNSTYKSVIDELKQYILENIDINEIDYISGGERRDWFFSNIIAFLLNKPHITVFKDLSTVVSDSNFENTTTISSLDGKKVLHIADLITIASSYVKLWIPAIKNLNGRICWSCVVVDRMQGGKEILEKENVKSFSLVQVDKNLFDKALNLGIINESQLKMLKEFFDNPDNTMRNFLLEHPEFIKNALNSDEKTAKRAKTLVDGNLYDL